MKDYGIGALEIALGPHGPPAGPPVRAPVAACAAAPVQQGGQGALSARRACLRWRLSLSGASRCGCTACTAGACGSTKGSPGGPSNSPSWR